MAKYRKIKFEKIQGFLNFDLSKVPFLTTKRKPARIFNGNLVITKAKKITVVADYPLSSRTEVCPNFEFEFKSPNGFTKQDFYEAVRSLYSKEIYKRAGYYGVWGHGIGDLVLESVTRRKNGKYYLNIGS